MKKEIKYLISIFLSVTTGIYPESLEEIITKDDRSWGHDGGSDTWDWCLAFKKNGKMSYIFAGEGSWEVKGNYEIRNDTIYINLTDNPDKVDIESPNKFSCKLKDENKSLKYTKKLVCTKKTYYGYAYKAINLKRTYKNIEIITLGEKSAQVLEPVIFRNLPNIKGKPIKCTLGRRVEYEYILNTSTALPKDTNLRVIGRSLKKEKINKWENYWYLVEVSYDPFDGDTCEKDIGWVYGEFIEIDNQ